MNCKPPHRSPQVEKEGFFSTCGLEFFKEKELSKWRKVNLV